MVSDEGNDSAPGRSGQNVVRGRVSCAATSVGSSDVCGAVRRLSAARRLARAAGRGYLYTFKGKKDMNSSGGLNVFPKQIERVLSADPEVTDVCVVAGPDDKRGDAMRAVVAREGYAAGRDRAAY